jgi:hypothetical protein
MAAVLALAAFAFYTPLGGQKVFPGKLLEDCVRSSSFSLLL